MSKAQKCVTILRFVVMNSAIGIRGVGIPPSLDTVILCPANFEPCMAAMTKKWSKHRNTFAHMKSPNLRKHGKSARNAATKDEHDLF